jgi:hypothetical protein
MQPVLFSQAERLWSGLLQFLHLWMRPWAQGEAHFPVWKEKQLCFALEEDDEFEYEVDLLEADFGLP